MSNFISATQNNATAPSKSAPGTELTSHIETVDKTSLNEELKFLPIQFSLSVGAIDDPLEHEADAVADKVMRMPETPFIQRCACEEEKIARKPLSSIVTPFIQTKSSGAGVASESVTAKINSSRGSGNGMDTGTRSFMENRFGADFGNVSIHTDQQSVQMNRELNAQAFTVGNDIYFNSGKYSPQSDSGKHLLAHELTHVLQQSSGQSSIASKKNETIFRTLAFGGVPDILDCALDDVRSNPATSCCTQHTLETLPPMYAESRRFTDRAIQRLNSASNMDGAIASHFGSGAIAYRNDILSNLRKIRAELDQESSHNPVCRVALLETLSTRDDERSTLDWYTQLDRSLFCDFGVVASASRQGKILTLCLDYEGNPSGGWSVVLHEVAHFSNVARLPGRDATPEQRERGEVETYVTQRDEGVYPNPMPYSLRNADSYAMFVKEVGDPNWNEESNPGRIAPNLELGGVMSLDGQYRLGTAGRLLWTPIGRNSQMTFGLSGLWFPEQGNTQNNSIPPDSLRAYTGAEIGFRWISEGHTVQFVLDVAGGGGAYFRTDEQVDTALASRIGLGVRIGGPQLGIGISVEAMKLFNLSDSDLTRDVTRDWLGGLMITGHWGGTSANPR